MCVAQEAYYLCRGSMTENNIPMLLLRRGFVTSKMEGRILVLMFYSTFVRNPYTILKYKTYNLIRFNGVIWHKCYKTKSVIVVQGRSKVSRVQYFSSYRPYFCHVFDENTRVRKVPCREEKNVRCR